MIKVVIFDLDDTLIAEKEYIKSGYREVARYLSEKYNVVQEVIYKELWEILKKGTKNVFNQWFEYHRITYSMENIKNLIRIYREHIPTELDYYSDVKPILKYLRKKNKKIGIISDGYISTQENKIKVLEAKKDFDKIILTENLGREFWKPHPRSFEIIRKYFDVEYEEMMYIGDNPKKDFYISAIHPITTVQICRLENVYGRCDYYEGIKPNRIINSLKELQAII